MRRTLGYLPQEFGVYPSVERRAAARPLRRPRRVHRPRARGSASSRRCCGRPTCGTFAASGWAATPAACASASASPSRSSADPSLIIVDEPTAGLDPAERVRFLNLLSEIGEQAVVILSTHIVEDVAELCSRMAIIDKGEILLEAEPLAAIAALRGRVWRRVVPKAELPEVERSHRVICTKLQAGRTLVHVYAESSTGTGVRAGGAGPGGRLLQRHGRPPRELARGSLGRARARSRRSADDARRSLPLRGRVPPPRSPRPGSTRSCSSGSRSC